jgi:hypothetical protein
MRGHFEIESEGWVAKPQSSALPQFTECMDEALCEVRQEVSRFKDHPFWGTEPVDSHALGELDEGNRPRQILLV